MNTKRLSKSVVKILVLYIILYRLNIKKIKCVLNMDVLRIEFQIEKLKFSQNINTSSFEGRTNILAIFEIEQKVFEHFTRGSFIRVVRKKS